MKIIQLNAWDCNLAPAIVDLFIRENPDIVCMQEVISAEKTGKILQSIEEILAEYPFEHTYYSPLARFRFMHGTAQRGNMILSKYPIVEQNTFWTHGDFQPDFDYSIGWNSARAVVHCVIKTPDGNVNVLTTHGYHLKEHKNGNDETKKACQQIGDYVDQLTGKTIVTGDFNLAPHSESLEILNTQLRNLCVENNVPTTRNYLTSKTETCDYIFVNEAVDVKEFSVLDDVVSDHKALRVVL